MIDQSHFSVETRRGQNGWSGDAGNGLQGVGIDELKVINREAGRGFGAEVGVGALQVNGRVLFARDCEVARGHECPMNAGGVPALLRSETSIAGGKGEAVLFPHGGMADHFHRDIQVSDHPPNQGKLLEVLVSEDRKVRANQVEQLQHDGENAIEVSRSTGSAEVLGEKGFGHQDRVVAMVDRFFFRGEGEIDPFRPAKCEVFLKGLGVVGEIAHAVKLDGIYENRDHHCAVRTDQLAGFPEEGEVTFVEGTHGGDESQRPGVLRDQFLDCMDVGDGGDHGGSVSGLIQNSIKNFLGSPLLVTLFPARDPTTGTLWRIEL